MRLSLKERISMQSLSYRLTLFTVKMILQTHSSICGLAGSLAQKIEKESELYMQLSARTSP